MPVSAANPSQRLTLTLCAAAAAALMSACVSTGPTLGDNKGTVSGAAGGTTAQGQNTTLEKCTETLGTMALQEDINAPWYTQLRQYNLGSTVPVLRLMIQQSNCFVIVERGGAMRNMQMERDLARSGEARGGSNMGAGQMVAADYTMSPAIQFSGNTGRAGIGALLPGVAGAIAGTMGRNEASTTLLLIDNRSGVQISAAEGTAQNFDFGILGGLGGVGGGGYSSTPQGKVIVAAFADSYNQMVKALRSYKAQTVKGGLGTGGRLGVDGGSTQASKEATAANAPAPAPAPAAAAAVPANAAKPVATKPAAPAAKPAAPAAKPAATAAKPAAKPASAPK